MGGVGVDKGVVGMTRMVMRVMLMIEVNDEWDGDRLVLVMTVENGE